MAISNLDTISQATIEAEAARQGVSVQRIIDKLFHGDYSNDYCQIYERLPDGRMVMRFDGKQSQPEDKYSPALLERVRRDLAETRVATARQGYIDRMQRRDSTRANVSEQEARDAYIQRLTKRR